jgi:hypothetical protein
MTDWKSYVKEQLSKYEPWIAKKYIEAIEEFKRKHPAFKVERYILDEFRFIGDRSDKQIRRMPYAPISTKSLQKSRSMASLAKNDHL